jgi:hypothetical protein
MKSFRLQKIRHPKNTRGEFIKKIPVVDQIVECLTAIWIGTFITYFIVFGTWLYFITPHNKPHIGSPIIETAKAEEIDLSYLGKMGEAIKNASKEFDVPIGLILGIANAESSMGKNFVHEYDNNCHNWWGIKPPTKTGMRDDGSYLRCLADDEAGARTAASLIKRLYLDEGLNTPEEIVKKWVGAKHSQYHDIWVENVKVYYK